MSEMKQRMKDLRMSVPEAEKLFLGQIIQHPEKLLDAEIGIEHFQTETHKLILRVIQNLEAGSQIIDVLSISAELDKTHPDTNWMPILGQYAHDSFTHSFFITAQKVIKELYKEREIKRITEKLSKDYDADKAIRELMNINQNTTRHSFGMNEAAMAAIEKAQESAKRNGLVGLTTGLKKLDETIGGFQSPDLYVIGARPAMGKTAVIINLMLNHNAAVGFFSTEQPHEQIGLRAIAATSNVSANKIRTAMFDDGDMEQMSYAVAKLASKEIYIYDKSHLTITELMREARRMKYNHDVKAIYVDYIQRVKADSENRRLEVAEVVTSLKSLARELQIPVIGLAQVNRSVEQRNDKRPHMGDLLESGVIEQEADVVMLLYRDEVYNEDSNDKGIIELLIDKNRHGVTGKIKFAWIAETMQIQDLYTGQNIVNF